MNRSKSSNDYRYIARQQAHGVRTADESGRDLDKIELPDAYYLSAGVAAKRRVVEAGYRLGQILDGLIE